MTYHPVLVRSPRLRLLRGFLRIGVEEVDIVLDSPDSNGPFVSVSPLICG